MRIYNEMLFAIYKNNLHLGNIYAEDRNKAVKKYLLSSYQLQFPDISIEEVLKLDNFSNYHAVKAISKKHYFKSEYISWKD